MSDFLKYGLFLIGGIALGALGAAAVSRGKLDLRPAASDLISRGIDIKDAIVGKVETLKEDAEDMLAQARQKADQRKAENVSQNG
ncbi:MAG: hypothetical protein IJU76_01405 [Desulfovibrionaceae bacterium]|nr:hypothetical protein [Desulfovibrionaceae bacterium]